MWPLLLLSVLAVAMSIERGVFWARAHKPGRRKWIGLIVEKLASGDGAAARELAADDRTLYGDALAAALRDPPTPTPQILDDAAHHAGRFAASLSVIITAAPLLGILGTVLGIIESFDLLGSGERVRDISLVAAGIAEALITTAFGLTVALVTLFPHMAFRSHAARAMASVETIAAVARAGARPAARQSPPVD